MCLAAVCHSVLPADVLLLQDDEDQDDDDDSSDTDDDDDDDDEDLDTDQLIAELENNEDPENGDRQNSPTDEEVPASVITRPRFFFWGFLPALHVLHDCRLLCEPYSYSCVPGVIIRFLSVPPRPPRSQSFWAATAMTTTVTMTTQETPTGLITTLTYSTQTVSNGGGSSALLISGKYSKKTFVSVFF